MHDIGVGSMAGIKVVGDDLGLDALVKELSKRSHLEIGVDTSLDPKAALKAIVNEFGYDSPGIPVTPQMRKWFAAQGFPLKKTTKYIKIPARPFISAGIYENLDEIWQFLDVQIDLVHRRKTTVKRAMHLTGAFIVKRIQDYMDENNSKENHPMTVANKGHANPLIGTGDLRDAITFEVVGGRKK